MSGYLIKPPNTIFYQLKAGKVQVQYILFSSFLCICVCSTGVYIACVHYTDLREFLYMYHVFIAGEASSYVTSCRLLPSSVGGSCKDGPYAYLVLNKRGGEYSSPSPPLSLTPGPCLVLSTSHSITLALTRFYSQ